MGLRDRAVRDRGRCTHCRARAATTALGNHRGQTSQRTAVRQIHTESVIESKQGHRIHTLSTLDAGYPHISPPSCLPSGGYVGWILEPALVSL